MADLGRLDTTQHSRLTLFGGSEWQTLFYYTSGYVGGSLLIRRAIAVIFVITLLAVVVGRIAGMSWIDLAQAIVFIPAIVIITRSVMWSLTTSWQLIDARKEIARLAVETERLRIARDLHDLLGHNLSLIALKSELSAARQILAAAGIAYRFEGDDSMIDDLPTTIESVLSWTVREGVTNVIRHSHAHHCTIHVTRNTAEIGIKVLDDGVGPSSMGNIGNGLRGLEERVESLGGRCKASQREEGGFYLAVSVPLAQQNHDAVKPATITSALSQQAPSDSPVNLDNVIERNGQP
jgi:two-component system, NarL family, sensor histidine kinase DesK